MSTELAAALGVAIAGTVALLAVPVVIRVAERTDFLDRPRGYRRHAAATPLLGGTAIMLAFVAAAVTIGFIYGRHYAVVLCCAGGLWALGTIDDRWAVPPQWRVLGEIVAASALFAAGLGWRLPAGDVFDLVLTVFWVVGVVNAFNLMDNIDGACASVGGVSALGIGTLAALHGQPARAAMAFALAAACAGFLWFNLARPARIFLGDGGSMPLGFLIAALGMMTSRSLKLGDPVVVAVGLLAGIVIFDTALVSVSRTRRGLSLLTGGRDHLTHRLLPRLGSARRVAAALALGQAVLCAVGIVGAQLGFAVLIALAMSAVLIAPVLIWLLDSDAWLPEGIAVAEPSVAQPAVANAVLGSDPWQSAALAVGHDLPASEPASVAELESTRIE